MKKKLLSLGILCLFTISCSNDEDISIKEETSPNLSKDISNTNNLTSRATTLLAYSPSINKLETNQSLKVDFYNIINTKETVELVMQSNEDLVCYYIDYFGMRKTIWVSGSDRPLGLAVPAYLTFQDDGDFAIYENHSSTPIWRLYSHWTGGKTQYRDFRLEVTKEGSKLYASLHLYRSGTWYKTVFKKELIVI